jgi:hypothetical protein
MTSSPSDMERKFSHVSCRYDDGELVCRYRIQELWVCADWTRHSSLYVVRYDRLETVFPSPRMPRLISHLKNSKFR